ncbi:hypothetical protein ACFV1A_12480 [Streptomyces seoulensis]|uniref:hypothetical protein n=1 Tax=Streptomyces seoulensis TaxID=73044 RepID=UPI00369C47D2
MSSYWFAAVRRLSVALVAVVLIVGGAAVVPSTGLVEVPKRPGTTAYEVTDTVLHALKGVPAPRVGEVVEFTHGRLAVRYGGPGGIDVALGVTVTTDRDRATVEMTAGPVGARKKLDGGGSWSVLTAVEPAVRDAPAAEV